jgi:hypothetical protein
VSADSFRCKTPSIITLADARARTNLELVSAKEINSEAGASYYELEEKSQSNSHRSAREHGVAYFSAIGFDIFPEGVGVRGVYTLADFLAIRDSRTIFVEVLSDANILEETIGRKCQLQVHGEVCFIVFSGTKRSDEANLRQRKRALESRADVVYCRLDGYGGNSGIDQPFTASIAYDTTRSRGIRVEVSFERAGRAITASLRFLTHLYQVTLDRQTYLPTSIRNHYEQIFLTVFTGLSHRLGHNIPRASYYDTAFTGNDTPAYRAMRKKSGLRMNDSKARAVARLRSEYRGSASPHIERELNDPFSSRYSADDIVGVVEFDKPSAKALRGLITVIEEHGLKVEFDAALLERMLVGP